MFRACKLLPLYFFIFYVVKDLCALIHLPLGLSQTGQPTNCKLWKVTDALIETHVFDRTYIYFIHNIMMVIGEPTLAVKTEAALVPSGQHQFLPLLAECPKTSIFSPSLSHTHTKHTHTHTHATWHLHMTSKCHKSSSYVVIQQKSIPRCVSKVLPRLISNSIINRLFQNPYTWSR